MRLPAFLLLMAASALALTGCTTQRSWFRKPNTKDFAYCGDSPLAFGQFASPLDAPCVKDFERKGWVHFQPIYCINIAYCQGSDFPPGSFVLNQD